MDRRGGSYGTLVRSASSHSKMHRLYLEKHRVGLGKRPEAPAVNQALSRSL